MLKRGRCSLIRLHSSKKASLTVSVTMYSTSVTWETIRSMRASSGARLPK
jgi:hypothetical protein